jgi:hypothetical protein
MNRYMNRCVFDSFPLNMGATIFQFNQDLAGARSLSLLYYSHSWMPVVVSCIAMMLDNFIIYIVVSGRHKLVGHSTFVLVYFNLKLLNI